MQLTFAEIGETHTVKGIWGDSDTTLQLQRMGFVTDASVTVLSQPFEGALILKIGEDKRVAMDRELIRKIMV